jgi:hypothetical protein
MTDTPPRSGITRENTGYRALPYSEGWYFTPEEVRAIERRAAKRGDRVSDEAILRTKAKLIQRSRSWSMKRKKNGV